MTDAQRTYPGVFITFEGGDGAGKSTHIRYLAALLENAGEEVVRVREPGGTAVGEALRAVVLDPAHTAMSDRAELLIYEAARAQIVDEVICPALRRGAVVLCDRFYDSTVAYQGFGRGLDRAFIDRVNAFAADGLTPDCTVLLTAAEADTAERMERRGKADRLEQEGAAFRQRVGEGFAALVAQEPDRVMRVQSQPEKADTFRAVLDAVAPALGSSYTAALQDVAAIEAALAQVDAEKAREKEARGE